MCLKWFGLLRSPAALREVYAIREVQFIIRWNLLNKPQGFSLNFNTDDITRSLNLWLIIILGNYD